jgi:hypothetical protein
MRTTYFVLKVIAMTFSQEGKKMSRRDALFQTNAETLHIIGKETRGNTQIVSLRALDKKKGVETI